MCRDGENMPLVFPEEFMTPTIDISEVIPQFLIGTSNVDDEVQVVDVEPANKEDNVDAKQKVDWDDLEIDTVDDDNEVQY